MPSGILLVIIGAIVILILVAIGVAISSSSERGLMEKRLGQYLEEDQKNLKQDQKSTPLSDWVNKRVEKSSIGERIARSLARADMKFKPGEFIFFIFILAGVLGGVSFVVVSGGMIQKMISLAIGVAFGVAIPLVYVNTQQGKRLTRFNNQLPDMLNLMVNGLRAGYSTMQAMEAISRELPAPISEEFRRVVQEMQLGLPMDKALDNLVRRIPSADLDFMVTAMNVQREVGGPLAEILDTISFTIRERIRIKGDIKTMTAQVVMSGSILAAVPFVIFVLLWFINPLYMGEFFLPDNLVCGLSSLGLGVTMIGIGYVVMMKIADIEV